jgi:hypothetical protein
LLASALGEFGDASAVIAAVLTGAAVSSGLLQILNDGAPLAERALSVPLPLCLAFAQAATGDAAWPGASVGRNASRDVPLPLAILAEAKSKARGLGGGAQHALVLRSGSMIEAKAVACEIAQSLRRRALFVDGEKGRGPNALSGLARGCC